jgi:phospholipase/carboxylesterase
VARPGPPLRAQGVRLAAVAALVLAIAAPAVAGPPMSGRGAPLLKARPAAAGPTLPAGETSLANGAVAYRPATVPPGPLPLLVLLHGAGGYPPGFLQKMEPVADRLGLILLAPRSAGPTWDLIENMQMDEDPWHGPDAHRLDQSLADLFSRAAIDPSHVVLLGFSDGASYALSLGLSNPKLFTTVIALSPGMLDPPRRVDREQQVFIAHGRSDGVLSFDAARDMAEALRRAGHTVRFQPFDGGHQIDPVSLTQALEWAFGLQASAPPPTSNPK